MSSNFSTRAENKYDHAERESAIRTEALIIFCSEARGGCEEYALTLGRALHDTYGPTAVAFPACAQTIGLVEDFERAGIRYLPLSISERGHPACRTFSSHGRRFRKTVRLLASVRPSACLLVTPSIQYMLGSIYAAAFLNIPSALCFQYVQNTYPFRVEELKYYHRAKARQAWIAVSEQNRRLLSQSFRMSESEIHVVPNGVDCSRFRSSDIRRGKKRALLMQEMKIPEDAFLFATVGAIRKQKGYDLVIPAFKALSERYPKPHWIWFGDGADRGQFENALSEHALSRRVHLAGYRNDIPDVLCACDAFVFPTRYEGQPFALLEAMAAGLPIITSDASGITEIIQDQMHGLVFHSGRSDELTQAMAYTLEHPETMRDMARRAASNARKFSADRMKEKTVQILCDLCRNSP